MVKITDRLGFHNSAEPAAGTLHNTISSGYGLVCHVYNTSDKQWGKSHGITPTVPDLDP